MKILFLGNSNFLTKRLRPTLDKHSKFQYIIASVNFLGNDKKVLYNNYVNAL